MSRMSSSPGARRMTPPEAGTRSGLDGRITAASYAAFCICILLAVAYFTRPGTWARTSAQLSGFYGGLARGDAWPRLGPGEVRARFDDPAARPIERLMLRAALARWMVRDRAPEALDRLLGDWDAHALWPVAGGEEWRVALAEVESRWKEARAAALASKAAVRGLRPASQSATARDRLELALPPGVPTAQLGTKVRLILAAPPDSFPTTNPRVAWFAAGEQVRESDATRAAIHGTAKLPDGRPVIVLDLDFGWEPAWLRPSTQINGFAVFAQRAGEWRVESMEFSD